MKTIKAKDAKFGRFYKCGHFTGVGRCIYDMPHHQAAGFISERGRIYWVRNDRELTELPPECDSFDWEPAKAGSDNPNGVRWYLAENTGSIRGYYETESMVVHSDWFIDKTYVREQQCIQDIRLSTAEVLCRLAQAGHVAAWNEARKLAGMSEQEAYLAGQSVCGLSVGDRVRVVRVADSNEMGWAVKWHPMAYCGNAFAVQSIDQWGVACDFLYPYHVLERIETPAEATPVETSAEVAPEIDPGEGWRLVSKDDPLHIGDEYLGVNGLWCRTSLCETSLAAEEACRSKKFTYRRRIQPEADHSNPWVGGYWKLGKWVSGRPCGVEVAQ